jgi:hypothetical protein
MYGRVILGKLATNEKSKKSLVIKASSMRSAYVNHFIHFPDFVIALIAGGLHLEKKKHLLDVASQQGCQMVYFAYVPKIPIWLYFGGPWNQK